MIGIGRTADSATIAPQELRHLADEACGLADEELLERGQTVDHAEAHVAHEAQQVRLVREQPVKAISR